MLSQHKHKILKIKTTHLEHWINIATKQVKAATKRTQQRAKTSCHSIQEYFKPIRKISKEKTRHQKQKQNKHQDSELYLTDSSELSGSSTSSSSQTNKNPIMYFKTRKMTRMSTAWPPLIKYKYSKDSLKPP